MRRAHRARPGSRPGPRRPAGTGSTARPCAPPPRSRAPRPRWPARPRPRPRAPPSARFAPRSSRSPVPPYGPSMGNTGRSAPLRPRYGGTPGSSTPLWEDGSSMADNENKNRQRRGGLPGFDTGGSGGSGNPQQDKARRSRLIITVVVLAFLAWILFSSARQRGQGINYSEFLQDVKRGPTVITDVVVGETSVLGKVHRAGGTVTVTAERPPGDDNGQLQRLLTDNGIKFTGSNPSGLVG